MAGYALPGLQLLVRTSEPKLLGDVDRVLGPFGAGFSHGDAELTVTTVAGGLPGPPDGAKLTWRGKTPTGLATRHWGGPYFRRIDLAELACSQVDLATGRAEILLRPSGRHCLVFGCLTPTVGMLLRRRGRHLMHGACLALPEPPHSSALVVGRSGTGKTTMAVAAAFADLRLLADDSSVLQLDETGCMLWGIPRPCKLHRKTMEFFPQLASLSAEPIPGSADELAVPVQSISPGPPLVAPADVVILLEERNPSDHRLAPIGPVEALTRLARENLRVAGDTRAEGTGGDAFAALAALARQARCYALSAGPNMASLGVLMKETLERQA